MYKSIDAKGSIDHPYVFSPTLFRLESKLQIMHDHGIYRVHLEVIESPIADMRDEVLRGDSRKRSSTALANNRNHSNEEVAAANRLLRGQSLGLAAVIGGLTETGILLATILS